MSVILVSRFLFSDRHYSREKNIVKLTAFLPKETTLATSVYNIDSLNEDAIWDIGNNIVPPGRNLHGRGDITSKEILSTKLNLELDNTPPRHANITGWPDLKEKRQLIALELADNSKLALFG